MTLTHSRSLATRSSAFVAMLGLSAALFGCAQSTSPVESTQRINGSSQTSASVFDIPTPTISLTSAAGVSGHDVTITIDPNAQDNAYYTTQVWYAQGTSAALYGAAPSATLNPSWLYNFWGGCQKTIVSSPSYSGHYEIQRSTDGGSTWTSLPDYTGNSCVDAGLSDGTYTYRVKSKSRENKGTTTMTHHSQYCEGQSITIESCTHTYSFGVGYDAANEDATNNPGNMDWVDGTHITANASGHVWNTHFQLYSFDNSCTGISSTVVGDGTDLYYSFDGSDYEAVPYVGGSYHLNGQANLHNPETTGTYTLIISTFDGTNYTPVATITVTAS